MIDRVVERDIGAEVVADQVDLVQLEVVDQVEVNGRFDIWIKDMMRELGTDDPKQVYETLCASLHVLRDLLAQRREHVKLHRLVRGSFRGDANGVAAPWSPRW